MNIILWATRLVDHVGRYAERARQFFYDIILLDHPCPRCGGPLTMIREGSCRCSGCDQRLDPTLAFQRCSSCGGALQVRVRRYECRECGITARSRFLFDELVFDAVYFREKVAESRQRKKARLERVRQMLADSRSGALLPGPINLAENPGLIAALNGLMHGEAMSPGWFPRGFDLKRYESHIQAHLGTFGLEFDLIPPLEQSVRLDRIWRFIAVIFLAHAGAVDLEQEDGELMVIKRETD